MDCKLCGLNPKGGFYKNNTSFSNNCPRLHFATKTHTQLRAALACGFRDALLLNPEEYERLRNLALEGEQLPFPGDVAAAWKPLALVKPPSAGGRKRKQAGGTPAAAGVATPSSASGSMLASSTNTN